VAVSELAVAFRQPAPAVQAAVLGCWGGAAAEPCWKCGEFVGRRVGRAAAGFLSLHIVGDNLHNSIPVGCPRCRTRPVAHLRRSYVYMSSHKFPCASLDAGRDETPGGAPD